MQWEIQLQSNQVPTHEFVKKIVQTVIEAGYDFNNGPYPARFSIIGSNPEEEIHHIGDNWVGGVDKILELFREYDPDKTSITIYFSRQKEPYIPFALAVIPRSSISSTLVSFQTQDKDIASESEFDLLLDLCQNVFYSFNFSFGGFTDEYNPPLPNTVEGLLSQESSRVLFLSSTVSDRINQKTLESLQAEEVRELEDGSLIIVLSKIDYPSQSQLKTINDELIE